MFVGKILLENVLIQVHIENVSWKSRNVLKIMAGAGSVIKRQLIDTS